MSTTCRKCGYTRKPNDDAPDYACPKCGAVYAKVEAALSAEEGSKRPHPGENTKETTTEFLTGHSASIVARRVTDALRGFLASFSPVQLVISIGILIAALSLLYYLLIALPATERQRLQIQRELIQIERNRESQRRSQLLDCRVNVENERNAYLAQFGTPIPETDRYQISQFHIRKMNELQRLGDMECARIYGSGE